MHIKPLAARTVGDPNAGDPSMCNAFCEAMLLGYSSLVMSCSSDHRKTSVREAEAPSPAEDGARKFDIEDVLDIEEKPDGDGEAPSNRCECEDARLSLRIRGDDICGVDDRRRETLGCRKGLESRGDASNAAGESIREGGVIGPVGDKDEGEGSERISLWTP